MPHWTIRTRDDDGNDEKIKVRAKDAGEAIALAEVEMGDVLSIKTKWGTWGGNVTGKYVGRGGRARGLAGLAAGVFIAAILGVRSDMPETLGTMATIGIYAAIFTLLGASVIIYGRRLARLEKQRADITEVIERIDLKIAWWQSAWIAWGLLIVGVALGVASVFAEQIVEDPIPLGAHFLPFLFLALVLYDPADFS